MTVMAIERKWPEIVVADTDVTPLPLPSVDYSGEPRDSTVESKSNSPSIHRRSRFTKVFPVASVQWVFTQVEYYAFVDFYTNDLGVGTAAFRMPIRYPENTELTEWVVRFLGDGFSARWLDGAWQVTAALEMINTYIIDDPAPL